MNEIKVVPVPKAETWPCDYCGKADVVAFVVPLNYQEGDPTEGYCASHLGVAVLSEVRTAK